MKIFAPSNFHVMAKPIGPICNIDCKYCYYLEKEKLYGSGEKWKMADDVLETFIRQYIEAQPGGDVAFAWQGGEPTLLGVDYFRTVVALQQRHAAGKTITNAIQTNGTLLDDEWCAFFAHNQFLVGLSIDGPRRLHDLFRVSKSQSPTFDSVLKGLKLLQKHGVEFNTLTVVNRANSQQPLDVYRFLKQIGSSFIQFIPLVERQPQTRLRVLGLDFAEPPNPCEADEQLPVTPWSLLPADYGSFLCDIFDEWVHRDVGRTFVQLFDVALSQWMGLGSPLCVFAEKCGNAVALEHNGDLYSCDHYVYPRYHLGNLMNHSLGEMMASDEQRRFGENKSDTLPSYCRNCEVRFACNGECPKHRFIRTPTGEEGLNYLCAAYRRFFNHIDPSMKIMCELLNARRAPSEIMSILARQHREETDGGELVDRRNALCACGSGRKFKKCCGR